MKIRLKEEYNQTTVTFIPETDEEKEAMERLLGKNLDPKVHNNTDLGLVYLTIEVTRRY